MTSLRKVILGSLVLTVLTIAFFVCRHIWQEKQIVTVIAVGDIMLDRRVEKSIKTNGKGDYHYPFLKIQDTLNKADILFGNLESVISDQRGEKVKKTGNVRVYFQADPKAVDGLKAAGFDILSVANNHALDYGRKPFEDSLHRLRDAGIEYVGGGLNEKECFSEKIIETKGVKVGFLAYTYPKFDKVYIPWRAKDEESGVAVVELEQLEKIKREVAFSKEKVDVLVVSFHAGKEYYSEPNKFQKVFSKAFIDAGADLVVGHHVHVPQPIESYKNGWIVYGLGHLVFDIKRSEETMLGLILGVEISGKKIQRLTLQKIKISDSYQAYPS